MAREADQRAGQLDGQAQAPVPRVQVQFGDMIVGDLLLSFAGAKLASLPDLVATLGEERVGKPTPLRLLRGGAPLELSLTPGARAASCC